MTQCYIQYLDLAGKIYLPPIGFGFCPFKSSGSVVGCSLFIVAPIICGNFVFGPCFITQY